MSSGACSTLNPSLVALVVAGILAAGCGDEGNQSATSGSTGLTGQAGAVTRAVTGIRPPHRQARGPAATVRAALTSGDPDLACRRLVSEQFVRRAYGDVQGCVAAVTAGGVARRVEVGRLVVRPDDAGGAVIAHGGPFDGRLQVSLGPGPDGSWVIRSLESNAPVGP